MDSVQMNVRIGRELKASGDGAFAGAGFTPTEVVRRVWEFASRNRSNRKAVTELMESLRDPDEVQQERDELAARRAEAEAWLEDLDQPIREYFDRFGIDLGNAPSSTPEEQERLLEEHYAEKYPELWSV